MITNKDIRVENGSLIINGDSYPLDGQSPEAIMQIVEDNSDTTPTENSTAPITSGGVFTSDKAISDTIGDITQTGVTGATVAAQIAVLGTGALKVAAVSSQVASTTADLTAIGGYKTGGVEARALSNFTGYPTGKTVVGWSLSAYGASGNVLAVVHVGGGYVYLNTAVSGTYNVDGFVFYTE